MSIRMRRSTCLLLLGCLAFLTKCRERTSRHVTPAIYYWKTVYNPTPYELKCWKETGASRVYVRCFDIAADPHSGMAKPVGVIRQLQHKPGTSVIPVVFITQDVLHRLQPDELPALAANTSKLLTQLFQPLPPADEVQIDCDWTAATREKYFSLLQEMRQQPYFKGKTLSATIRLHQIKYRLRSGIPPVDRGLLMCYNMGNLKQPGTHNSILDVSLAEDYLQDLHKYPLGLDVALPLFRWCLQFRNGRLKGILRDVPPEAVQRSPIFRHKRGNLFTCVADTVWMDYSFQAGDEIRTETPEIADILKMAAFTAQHIRNDSLRVVLFHSDSLTLAKYPADDLKAIYNAYR